MERSLWEIRHTPYVAADLIILLPGNRIVLVERKNPPHGYALPGGFVEWGETVEEAAVREAFEETGLKIEIVRQFHTYSDPKRDPRFHTVSIVFESKAEGEPQGGDDAAQAVAVPLDRIPENLCFDHNVIMRDFLSKKY